MVQTRNRAGSRSACGTCGTVAHTPLGRAAATFFSCSRLRAYRSAPVRSRAMRTQLTAVSGWAVNGPSKMSAECAIVLVSGQIEKTHGVR